MKNVKELQAILPGILVINNALDKPCKEIDALCEYAFRNCFEAPTELLRIATRDFSRGDIIDQVNVLLRDETKFRKVMGTFL